MRRIVLAFAALATVYLAAPSASPTTAAASLSVAAVGDLCGSNCNRTADLVSANDPSLVLTLGDDAYPRGTSNDFRTKYDPSWGTFRAMTEPAPGNHEYETRNASGYRDYFGFSSTERLYRSFDYGGWHFVQYNTEQMNTAQINWIRSDLAANATQCEIAYGHKPRWSSGEHGSPTRLGGLWNTLAAANVDIVLNGHDHDYERIYRDGVREFVVGTGGKSLNAFGRPDPGSQFRYNANYGVLFLTLGAGGTYGWLFRSVSGSVIDSGTGVCH
jgi:hypothetical protein